jgi:low temperature requirement protein LtrA
VTAPTPVTQQPPRPRRLLRDRSGEQRVTNIELFFDLVYVFAVTQLSHYLLSRTTVAGAGQTAILLAMVWLAWMYTTWVTNWLDPERMAVRLLLVLLMLVSLAMSAALPHAFGDLGIWVGGAYALMQIGRTAFMIAALPTGPLRSNFERIEVWCVASGALAVAGGLAHGHARELLWLAAIGVDILGGIAGFATPWLGRSRTADWTIEGSHIAERCQAFILIALGESIVIIGATLSMEDHVTATSIAAFIVAFAGSVALWWLYFDRSADASTAVITSSNDPGRLGRSAYHLIHPFMVAGIIVAAAGDEKILTHPESVASAASGWLILGGPALFLAGHAAFKRVMWGIIPCTRLAGIAVLALLALAVPVLPEIALSACAAVTVAAVAATDRRPHPEAAGGERDSRAELFLFGVADDANAVVGEQEREVLKGFRDREQQVRHGPLRVAAEHPLRQAQLR